MNFRDFLKQGEEAKTDNAVDPVKTDENGEPAKEEPKEEPKE